ncbi:MAG: Ribosomal RNA large subunit methyltransferase I [Deltaproteobacteria bacterium ADurb.Bin207]|jgi:23S rRNA (cytosine1962-C5)-methyltransferase|nr:MAG: Ribosomal RNA large subunit methyltransferase I [Deltaproteobacteria bacterium ADurb.Bin207]HPY20105.1 class I SAM-dependent rRNA methyltransferase [Polyangiaceae bacterium]HQF22717.1 class I SAM-dependent rRNA methyltransferase [Polyangiaceae bacterium]
MLFGFILLLSNQRVCNDRLWGFPQMNGKALPAPLRISIDARSAHVIRRGHPWIWRSAVRATPQKLDTGALVTVFDTRGQFVAHGLWDSSSPIAARVYSRIPQETLGLGTLTSAVLRAVDDRNGWFDLADTDAFRLCHGEGDRVPGVVLDRYGTIVVARFDGEAISTWSEMLLGSLWPALKARGFTALAVRDPTRGNASVRVFAGERIPDTITVRERGMKMVVDLMKGQKTGAFLDQRENRRRIRALASRARVLNLFSYSGGFSCAAALGGAAHVTSVDIAHAAHAIAHETFRQNGIDPNAHSFITADVFLFLERAIDSKERFDLVISDPPSFAPNEKSLPKALHAYRRLHEACLRVVAKGGLFCAASCSSHVTLDAFIGTLDDEVLAGRPFRIVETFGQPADHPTVPGWPEGRYLKFVVMAEAAARQASPSHYRDENPCAQ